MEVVEFYFSHKFPPPPEFSKIPYLVRPYTLKGTHSKFQVWKKLDYISQSVTQDIDSYSYKINIIIFL